MMEDFKVAHIMIYTLVFVSCFLFYEGTKKCKFFWQHWGLSSGLRPCQTGMLPLEPLYQPFFVLDIFEIRVFFVLGIFKIEYFCVQCF
jgi:hypothetical protein